MEYLTEGPAWRPSSQSNDHDQSHKFLKWIHDTLPFTEEERVEEEQGVRRRCLCTTTPPTLPQLLEWYISLYTFDRKTLHRFSRVTVKSVDTDNPNPLTQECYRHTFDEWVFLGFLTMINSDDDMELEVCRSPAPKETLEWWWGDASVSEWIREDATSKTLQFFQSMSSEEHNWPQGVTDVCTCSVENTICLTRLVHHTRFLNLLWHHCARHYGRGCGSLPEWSPAWKKWWKWWLRDLKHWLFQPLDANKRHVYPLLWEAATVIWRQVVFDASILQHTRRPFGECSVGNEGNATLGSAVLRKELLERSDIEFSPSFSQQYSNWTLLELLPLSLSYRYEKVTPSLRSVFTSDLYLLQWAVKDQKVGYAPGIYHQLLDPDFKELCQDPGLGQDPFPFPHVYYLMMFSSLFEATFDQSFLMRYCVRDTIQEWKPVWATSSYNNGLAVARPLVYCVHGQYIVAYHPACEQMLDLSAVDPLRWNCGQDVCLALVVWLGLVYRLHGGYLEDGVKNINTWFLCKEWIKHINLR